MRLSRRIADALCAFETGHSVRDLDRCQRRRMRLLGDRLSARLQREADDAAGWPFGENSFFLRHARALAQEAVDLTDRAVIGKDRVAQARLAKKLDIERASLDARRRQEWREGERIELLPDGDIRSLEPLGITPVELQGRFHKGLTERRSLYLGFHEQGFCRRYWHVCLHHLRLSVSHLLERAAGSLHRGGYEDIKTEKASEKSDNPSEFSDFSRRHDFSREA